MSQFDQSATGDTSEQEAATEAAQHVVDKVTSWDYSAERDRVEEQLETGLDEAGVSVPGEEQQRIVDEIQELKETEDGGAPDVTGAKPQPGE